MENINLLKEKLKQIIPPEKYPQNIMIECPHKESISFFPGGKGLYKNVLCFPTGKIMVVGQDWGTNEAYNSDINNDDEKNLKGATWSNIKKIFDKTDIKMDWCFFTNAIMGLRTNDKILGKSPAFKNIDFIELCKKYFIEQLNVCKPKIIISLGTYVPLFLQSLFDDDNFEFFRKKISFKEIDKNNKSVLYNIKLKNYSQKVNIIFLTHPSLYFVNVRWRKYQGKEKMEAEIQMIKDCLLQTEGLH